MNCKPGDLAVIVSTVPEKAKNIGAVVLVVSRYTGPQLYSRPADWNVEFHGRMCLSDDAGLRPITPPPGTITTDEVRELYAPKVPAKEEA